MLVWSSICGFDKLLYIRGMGVVPRKGFGGGDVEQRDSGEVKGFHQADLLMLVILWVYLTIFRQVVQNWDSRKCRA